MIHRTYRRLDEPPTLAGFSFAQWLGLLMLGGAVYGVCRLLSLPTQPAISLFTLLVGGPAALIYFSESGRPSLLRLVRDFLRWALRSHVYEAGSAGVRPLRINAKARSPRRRRHRSSKQEVPE
jgi:hypothetical protein